MARNLRPGDRLCTDVYAEYKSEPESNAYRLYSAAYVILWGRINPNNRSTFPEYRKEIIRQASTVEHVSHGPWKARVVTAGGAVVRVPKDRMVTVYRRPDSS
jgi:hypothetical protein